MATLLGLGCDLVYVERIARMAQRSPQVFFERVLGGEERAWLVGCRGWARWARCARHVAAKEALFKALGTGLIGAMRWTDVQVVYAQRRPQLLVSGAARTRMAEIGARKVLLTLAGDRHYALATVLLTGPGVVGDAHPEMMAAN